jgi:hypothetical protein
VGRSARHREAFIEFSSPVPFKEVVPLKPPPLSFARLAGVVAVSLAALPARALPPRFDHIVVVVEENHTQGQIIGNTTDAPYMNALATGGASFTGMYGLIHPSQPNYLQLFSGSTQGNADDNVPVNPQGQPTTTNPFVTPNLGAAVRGAGFSFGGYSQTQPAVGSQVDVSGAYHRKHNPWSNWQDNNWASDAAPPAVRLPNTLPKSVNMTFGSFPSDYTKLPTVSFVVPDQNNDMHDGTIAQADAWLKSNIDPYVTWAKAHNSLLIVTWDEDNSSAGNNNRIPTIMAGARVKAGVTVAQTYTSHNLLRTIEDVYGLSHSGNAASVKAVVGAFTTDPSVTHATFRQGAGGYAGASDTQVQEGANAGTAYASATSLSSDGDWDTATAGSQRSQALVKFGNIVSGAGGSIPTDATVLSAKLTLYTTSATVNAVEVHRMVSAWNTGSTWNSLGAGVSANGTEAAVASDFTHAPPLANVTAHFDVTDTVQRWVEGSAANNGWVILPTGADGFAFVSSEGATAAQRPTLDVAYTLYPRFSAAGGSWATASNWANGTPNGTGAVARFLTKSAASAVTLDGNKTAGEVIFDSANAYTLSLGTGGTLTMSNNGNVATIRAKQGQHTLGVPVSFADPGSLEVASGAKVTATAGVTVAAGTVLSKDDAGVAQVSGGVSLGAGATADVRGGELRVDRFTGAGALAVRGGAAARLTSTAGVASVVTGVSLDGATGAWAGTVDVGRAGLVVNYTGASPIATVADQVRFARSANWTGPGIGTSAGAADGTTGVAVAEASALLGISGSQTASFMNVSADATSLLVRFTKAGDATMDGTVDFSDLVKLAQNYNTSPGAGTGAWVKGDFNYDGTVDFSDMVMLAQNYNTALPADGVPGALPSDFSADWEAAVAQAPEPGMLAVIGFAAALAVLPRRSRSS